MASAFPLTADDMLRKRCCSALPGRGGAPLRGSAAVLLVGHVSIRLAEGVLRLMW
eukprot:CAMPEP_0173401044 /NCGR_PEP_ID=MMETSP1356-20130122/49772_1 /TAXON_ID=77927 ORGANISM="Hemiselmis virescens, Strain PCC157" /NCGR_SAMPLE_ID=MMETSP1356 /ASSEMBLY_ACC=CAM_ASM_000847 /LENGTH=54 /DNA_ID=CAMNT_0014361097 /DNA_START=120 /DNA_END=281 /DNA_ORIENTATION=+